MANATDNDAMGNAGTVSVRRRSTHDIAAFADMTRIRDLLDDLTENEGEALRYAGYRRSQEILESQRVKLEKLAHVSAERSELDQAGIEKILMSNS